MYTIRRAPQEEGEGIWRVHTWGARSKREKNGAQLKLLLTQLLEEKRVVLCQSGL
jgi:hypothetical protein